VDFAALFHVFQSWGPSAVSSVLVIVVLDLIKRADENSKEDARRAKVFQEQLEVKVSGLYDTIHKGLEAHSKRLSYIGTLCAMGDKIFCNFFENIIDKTKFCR
jgi:hypothetical protein